MPQQFLSQFKIKIGGADAPQALMDDVVEAVVDSSLYLPEMFTILLQDLQLKWADDSLFQLGKEVEITGAPDTEVGGQTAILMKGEIAALEPDFSAEGKTMMLVRGYNKAHRLHRGRKTRTFLKKTDSDIARTLAGEVGLSATVDATTVTHDYVIQNNQTNMEFLQSRAERLGYQVFAAEGKLYFKKGDAELGSGPELKLGENLRSFRPVLAATHQADKVIVQGWDPGAKQAITGQAQPTITQGGVGKTGGAMAQQAFSAAETKVVNQPVATAGEASALATGLANDLGHEFIQAEGVCVGNPKVKAGYTITIKGVGTRFSGKYYVTSAIHIYNQQGYETRFTISGRQPNTISHLLETNHNSRALMPGLVIGLVTNNNSSEKDYGYVKVKYPWLNDQVESDWIRMVGPGGGAERGIYWLPEVNDEVALGFEHGDIHRPYVLGGLWNGKDKPPVAIGEAVKGGKVNQRIIKSRSGHQIILNDEQGKEQILVKSKAGHQLILDDASGAEKYTIKDKTGNNMVEIDSAKNSITISSAQDLTLKCNNKLTLQCTELNIEAKTKGTIKANAALTLESTGKSDFKGAQVSVNGSAMVQIQGAIVKIN